MSAQTHNNKQTSPPLTTEEKNYLKKHWGGDFKCLMMYELSIYKEEDRKEGRSILRAIMTEDTEEEAEDADESNDFLTDLERDPSSHVAEYKFTSDQLDFLKKQYGHSGSFMLSYGLKPWDDGDCGEAVSIVKALMDNKN
jgi:hypothetical protein